MKLALLADDEESVALVRHATADRGHELVWCSDISDRQRLERMLPGAMVSDDWEPLLAGVADCVVVARGAEEERQADQLRKLVAAGVPVVVTHPVTDAAIFAYELEMIRAESGGRIIPYFPWRAHPVLDVVRAVIRGECGKEWDTGVIEQITFERPMADRSRQAVLRQLARDVDLVRSIAGEISRVGATAAEGGRQADFAQLSVAMETAGPLVRWSVAPAHANAVPRLSLVGERGSAVLEMPSAGDWSMTVGGDGPPRASQWTATNVVAETWERIERGLTEGQPLPMWLDAARTLDIADCVSESVRRGRWIDAVQENYTGEGAYKGLMGMVGCGLLLLALASFLIVALFQMMARQAGWRDAAALLGKWPYVLVAVLCSFLALQALRWLGPRRSKPNPAGEP